MEVWKAVKGYEGYLAVSNKGRVKSFMRNPDGNILKAQTDNKGYLRLTCAINGVKVRFKVHRLVAEHFVDNPDNKPQVNHIDGNKQNNESLNLEWVTMSENAVHAIKNGLWENQHLSLMRKNEAKKTPIIATNIETGKTIYFKSMCEAERVIGTRHINHVINGTRRQAKGYTFRYAKGGDANAS